MTKIARIAHQNQVVHALIDDDGAYRPIEGDLFGSWHPTQRTIPAAQARLLAPVTPPQVICIGANYRKHCEECNAPIPDHPLVFFKLGSAVIGPDEPIVLPRVAPDQVDWEAELVIVIGKRCRHVSVDEVDDFILGYTCGNDISARDCQLKLDKQWARGKSFDTFAPIGPHIVAGLNSDDLNITLTVNGQTFQNSNTSDMIFSCRTLVSYLSQSFTLMPGSIIMTGTPSGVGMGLSTPRFLKPGDTTAVTIEGVGTLTNPVVAEDSR
jgi:2-keto-4-pentenoate hydratase/2-oxohepta-3-ene-1,7-dioic acid hydratase in catechol pathway